MDNYFANYSLYWHALTELSLENNDCRYRMRRRSKVLQSTYLVVRDI